MAYIITRTVTLPRSLKTTFPTYEAARSAARKWIRSKFQDEMQFFTNANPALREYGMSIKKVA